MPLGFNDTRAVPRVPPRKYHFSLPYWEATREQRLLLQYCLVAEKYQFFPRPVSIYTGRNTLEWREVSGEGEVFTYTIARRGPAAFHGHEPYVIVNVRLDVGVHILANLVDCEASELRIGLRVRPWWLPLADGTHLLMFQPQRPMATVTAERA